MESTGQEHTGMVVPTVSRNGSIAPALGPILDHIRVGMAANRVPRLQGAGGTATGLVVLLIPHTCPGSLFCLFLLLFLPLILASATASGARTMPGRQSMAAIGIPLVTG